ncbi:MAG TPA: DUF2059 domain-containing protein [Xanthobacteraceae bacterium]
MPLRHPVRAAALAGLLALMSLPPAPAAAQEPSAASIAAARDLIQLKGAASMFDPVVPGVIETAKNMFMQTNMSLAKDLNEVAAQLRKDYAGKTAEIANEMARIYAQQFSEKEIAEAVAFYRTPLGKKLIEVEPKVLEQGMTNVQNWADRFSEEVTTKFRAEMRKKGHNL